MSNASRFVRPSKFRHVFAETTKPEACYTSLDLSPNTGDHNYIRCSPKFFSVAVRGGGGPVLVLPYSAVGKLPTGAPTINGHSAAVYDTAWNPFNDNMLATSSDDTTVKVWSIPDGGLTEPMRDPLVTLNGHGKPVSLLQWHPTANNVIASAGKEPSVKIWDVEKAAAKISLEGFGGLVQDMAWSHDGAQLMTSTKDKLAKVHDPRGGSIVHEWTPHEGGKAFKTLFLGESGRILTVGFTKQSKREFKIWDVKATTSKALATFELDQASGVMIPFYDEDTRMLYLTGKGDGNVRYFELVDEEPSVYLLSEHRTNVSTKGADMLPKRACAPMRCEVARMLKLVGDAVEPISFIVPRKSEAFQEDIFPDTYAGKPVQSADEWFSGATVAPKKISMDPAKHNGVPLSSQSTAASFKAAVSAPAPAPAPASTASAPPAAPAAAAVSSAPAAAATAAAPDVGALQAQVAALSLELKAAKARIAELEAKEGAVKATLERA